MTKHRVAIIGFGHMHINNVAALYAAHPGVEWVGCADTTPLAPERRAAPYTRAWNLANLVERLGSPRVYDDYHQMLAEARPEIVIVTCENAQHAPVVEACAAAGAHVCVEKPLAPTLADALRMARASEAAGTQVITNWPLTWSPGARKAQALAAAGAIGRVIEIKHRSGHAGPLGTGVSHAGVTQGAEPMSGPERGATWWHQAAAGGGAYLDFTCYGALFSRWVLGEPAQAALGLKANLASPWGDADDNGVLLVRYPGALALLEGSWTTHHHGVGTGPILYGTEGTLVVETVNHQALVRLERGHGDTQVHAAEALPAGRHDIAHEVIHHLETGAPLHPTLEMGLNLDVTAILDAGARSAASGRLEPVDNRAWQIG